MKTSIAVLLSGLLVSTSTMAGDVVTSNELASLVGGASQSFFD